MVKASLWALIPACLIAATPVSDSPRCAPAPSNAPVAVSIPPLEFAPVPGDRASQKWWAQAGESIERLEYEAAPTGEGFQAPNRAQQLRTWFRYDGVEVFPKLKHGGAEWVWKYRTLAWGREGSMRKARATEPVALGSRVEYRREGMVEWYENQRGGVEQGFTLAKRPAGEGPLRVEGKISDELHARPGAGGDAVSFVDRAGAKVLDYANLAAWDARGVKLEARLEAGKGSLVIEVDDRDAMYPLTIDPLMTTPAWSAESNQEGANFGYSVATAGDVNGDGFDDVIVGAYQYDNGEANEGRVFVYYGTAVGVSSSPAWSAEGNQEQAFFGVSVAAAGDVNNDGYSDVIVGAELYDGSQSNDGRAFLYLGSALGLAAAPAWIANGGQAGARFGCSVATAGDVNGDGFDDVVVGASDYSNGEAGEGRALVYLGSASGLAASPAWTAEGNQAGAHFGGSVGTAGDVNGDVYDDVIVGAHEYSNGQTAEGRAFVYLGSASGPGAAAAWTAESNQGGAFFGKSVATAGDVNADGFADVIVGAYAFDNGQSDEGRAFVFKGSALGLGASPVWTAECNVPNAAFGWSVGSAGDANGDGYADVIIGAYAFNSTTDIGEGKVFVYDGSASGLGVSPSWSVEGNQGGAFLGQAAATAGDVNNDGYSDIIVGAYAFDNGQSDEGRASVYLGTAGPATAVTVWTAESIQAHAHLGFVVASAGDVNGDGFADVIVGAPYYDNAGADGGRAYVYHGSSTGLLKTAAWAVASDQDSSLFAYSVASAGDVNGDGYDDVIVGAYQYDNGATDEGRAYVYLGSATGLAHSPAWTAESDQADARFGYSVAGAGDVNGDGFADVIIGAHRYDNGQTDEGRAFVYLGSASGLAASPAWTAESNQSGAALGSAVATAGDVNGDGFSDVIVGAPRFDAGEKNEGRAFVYLGSASGLGASPAWNVESNQEEALFGTSVATAGDANGDGYSDVIVGAYLYDDGEADEGRAYFYRGSAAGLGTIPTWIANGNQAGAFFGYSVASAGDNNHDGYADLIVGAYGYDSGVSDEGKAFVYRGSAFGPNPNFSWTEDGNQPGALYGWSVAPAGDVNDDTFGDVIVGAHKYDGVGPNAGRALAYRDLRGTSGSTTAVPGPVAESIGLRFGAIFPNPARSQSVMDYVLTTAGPMRLTIHDIMGRRVATLADRTEEAGAHSATWEGRDARGSKAPAGVYWARLESAGEAVASKIVRR